MKSIIFDLDLTLVDSTIAEVARSRRDWNTVYNLIPQFSIYNGIEDVFNIINELKITTTIVSTAPKSYIERVVKYFDMPINFIVGYHDAKPIKPHPAPMIKAIELLQTSNFAVVSFGDRVIDLESSHRAGIKSVGCTWGSRESDLLRNSFYTSHIIEQPLEIIDFLFDD